MAKKAKARIIQYRDRKTGRFVSASTWRRSKAKEGTRYVRESRKRTRRRRMVPKAPPALPKAAPPQRKWIDWMIQIKIPGVRGEYPTKIRDFIVPGWSDSTFYELRETAATDLPNLAGLIGLWRKHNTTVSQGPRTRRRKAELR